MNLEGGRKWRGVALEERGREKRVRRGNKGRERERKAVNERGDVRSPSSFPVAAYIDYSPTNMNSDPREMKREKERKK